MSIMSRTLLSSRFSTSSRRFILPKGLVSSSSPSMGSGILHNRLSTTMTRRHVTTGLSNGIINNRSSSLSSLLIDRSDNNFHYENITIRNLSLGRVTFSTTASSSDDERKDTTTTNDTTNNDKNNNSDDSTTASTSSTPPPLSLKNKTKMEFQAETRQLLDIVTHSLYTDKEVFLRELVSNASDALEKLRHLQTSGQPTADLIVDKERPLEIHITLDEVDSSITIQDTGIGMTKDELVDNLGTIARSGSKNFVARIQEEAGRGSKDAPLDIARGIIGKFGVGFYSVFMVAHTVQVTTQPAIGGPVTVWTSDGVGTYEVAEIDQDDTDADIGFRQDRGTTIKIYLDSDYWSLLSESKIQGILKKYSNFVQFPIYLNGSRVNTVQAVWGMDPREVEYETYVDFYKYIAQAIDDPLDILHFRADAPLEVQALLFIPSFHSEKYGMERMEPGVSLYSRKVLIESKSPDILPDWLRFVKGVVDSEDLPLSLSREKPQDTALIRKLKKALTRKFLSHLEKMAKKEPEKYVEEFYREYNHFLKEGICQDFEFQSTLSKLLRFETNKNTTRKIISLDEYISNLRPEQNEIYYLVAPTREAAAMSPYLEAFERANIEVIFVYTAIDDFVLANLDRYEGRRFVSVEKSDIDLSKFDDKPTDSKSDDEKAKEDGSDDAGKTALSATEAMDFCLWLKTTLGDNKVGNCRPSSRLVSSPAIVTDNESGMMRRMMRMVDASDGTRDTMPLPKQNVEINPSHPVIVGLYRIKDTEPVLARVLAEQVYDNCLVAAGLLDDSRTMLPRLNDLLVALVKGAQKEEKMSTASSSPTDIESESDGNKDSDKTKE